MQPNERTDLQHRVTAAVMMADIDITSGARPPATDEQYQAIADRLIEKVIGPERLLAAVLSADERRDWGTSDHPMTEAEWRAAPRDGAVERDPHPRLGGFFQGRAEMKPTETPEARIAEALVRAHFADERDDCACGWKWDRSGPIDPQREDHLAAVIAALPDIAIIELPAATEWHGEQVYPVHLADRDEAFVEIRPDGSIGSSGISNPMRDIPRAGKYAAALLAAARAADGAS